MKKTLSTICMDSCMKTIDMYLPIIGIDSCMKVRLKKTFSTICTDSCMKTNNMYLPTIGIDSYVKVKWKRHLLTKHIGDDTYEKTKICKLIACLMTSDISLSDIPGDDTFDKNNGNYKLFVCRTCHLLFGSGPNWRDTAKQDYGWLMRSCVN